MFAVRRLETGIVITPDLHTMFHLQEPSDYMVVTEYDVLIRSRRPHIWNASNMGYLWSCLDRYGDDGQSYVLQEGAMAYVALASDHVRRFGERTVLSILPEYEVGFYEDIGVTRAVEMNFSDFDPSS